MNEVREIGRNCGKDVLGFDETDDDLQTFLALSFLLCPCPSLCGKKKSGFTKVGSNLGVSAKQNKWEKWMDKKELAIANSPKCTLLTSIQVRVQTVKVQTVRVHRVCKALLNGGVKKHDLSLVHTILHTHHTVKLSNNKGIKRKKHP